MNDRTEEATEWNEYGCAEPDPDSVEESSVGDLRPKARSTTARKCKKTRRPCCYCGNFRDQLRRHLTKLLLITEAFMKHTEEEHGISSQGCLPRCGAIRKFLDEHGEVLADVSEERVRIQLLRTKVLDERKRFRESLKRRLQNLKAQECFGTEVFS